LKSKQLESQLHTLPKGEAEESKDKPLSEEEIKRREQKRLKRKRALQNKKKKWFEAKNNTFVYA
jgi:hypothetical protein